MRLFNPLHQNFDNEIRHENIKLAIVGQRSLLTETRDIAI